MPGPIDILAPDIAKYLAASVRPREGVLARLEKEADAEDWPIVPPGTAALLDVIVRLARPERVLEVGAAIGYSAIVIAQALPPWGHLDTIELDPETAARAEANIREAGLGKRVVVHRGPALEVIPRLENRYDLVFLDAAKEEYAAYLERTLPLLPKGGVVLADNLLWGGRVATGPEPGDAFRERTTAAIRAFNDLFLGHPELRAQVVAVGDGLGIGVKV